MFPPSSTPPALNVALLKRLQSVTGQYLAVGELGDDPAQVWRDLEDLERFGFQIERHPVQGASYLGPSARLCPDQIEYRLGTRRIGRRLAVWNRVGSSNDVAAQAGSNLANDGLVVLAEEQVSGRGQRGRRWIAPPGSSILMSVLLFPPPALDSLLPKASAGAGWMTAMAAVAVAELVSEWTGAPARIKWPNDVRVDGRKIAGILVERALVPLLPDPAAQTGTPARMPAPTPAPPPRPRGVVIGIGLNVHLARDAFPQALQEQVTALNALGMRVPADRSEIARDLIVRLDTLYDHLINRNLGPLALSWRTRSEHLGKVVRVVSTEGELRGRLVGLDLEQGLTLDTGEDGAAGQIRELALGSVLALEE